MIIQKRKNGKWFEHLPFYLVSKHQSIKNFSIHLTQRQRYEDKNFVTNLYCTNSRLKNIF